MLLNNSGATPFGIKNVVQITDGGGYAEKGPVKTEEGNFRDFMSGSALEAMKKVDEEARKRREESLIQQEKLRQSFKDLEVQLETERQKVQDELQQSISELSDQGVSTDAPATEETAAKTPPEPVPETPPEPIPETPPEPIPETPPEPIPETPPEPIPETAKEDTDAAANEAAAQAAAAMAAEGAALEGDNPPAVPEDL